MTDYAESLVAARIALQQLEEAASDSRFRDMAAHAHALEVNAEAIRFWAFSQPTPAEPTV